MKNLIYKLTFCTIAIIAIAFNLTTSANAASSGALDTTFGTSGFVVTNITGNDVVRDITVMDDGKIVAVGNSSLVNDFMVLRYLTNGTLDTTFSGDGIQFVDVNSPLPETARKVLIQQDGKILIFGRGGNFTIVRLDQSGNFDNTFSSDGIFQVNSAMANFDRFAVALQNDGKIVIGSSTANDVAFSVVRINENGTLDTTFDTDGVATLDLETASGSADRGNDVDIQSNEKIVLTGRLFLKHSINFKKSVRV